MTTTELIKLLEENEIGGISKRPREISFSIPGLGVLGDPEITISSTGDGICGPEITLEINGGRLYEYKEEDAIKPTWRKMG